MKYDSQGHNAGTTIIDERDDGNGRTIKNTTNVRYDAEGHDAGRTITETTTDGHGQTTTTTTNIDGNGHVTGSSTTTK